MNPFSKTVIIIFTIAASSIFIGCNLEAKLEPEALSSGNAQARVLPAGWDQFTEAEIAAAAEDAANVPVAKQRVFAFDGALTKLFNIGVKKLNIEIESDAGAAFADFTKSALTACLKYGDGLLNNYTFGFYKMASGILFPDKATPDPQIEKLQESVDKLQDSVDSIKFQLANLSDDLKYEFDGLKVAERMKEIERQKTAFDKMFTYLKYANPNDEDIDLMTYYELKNYAIEAFGSVDKMRQTIQNFFTDYYKGDAVATRTYGESYRLIGEELFAWRYQTADFMETLIGQELELATKLYTLAGIMLDPTDNTNMMFDMMIQETMKNSVDAERLEKLVKMNATSGTNPDADISGEIIATLCAYWNIQAEESFDIRTGLLTREYNVANDAWNNLADAFCTYEKTIEDIEVPVDKKDEITCNIRGVRCTFSRTMEAFNYAELLSDLAELSVSQKTEAAWLKLYTSGCLPSEKADGYVRMLTKEDYGRILDFYKNRGLVVTDSMLCNLLSQDGTVQGRVKMPEGTVQETTLVNIFRYDAGINIPDTASVTFACRNEKETMGFIVDNERQDYGMELSWLHPSWNFVKCFDGLHFWNVKVPAVRGDTFTLKSADELLLEDMAARKSDKSKINRIKYYNDSKASDKAYLVPNVVAAF